MQSANVLMKRLDGHNDLAILIRALFQNYIYGSDFTDKFENGGLYGQVDHPRLKKGKVGGSFWSAFTPCPANGSDFSDANYVECKSDRKWTKHSSRYSISFRILKHHSRLHDPLSN